MTTEPQKQPTWAECRACTHRWIAVYVPISLELFALCCKRAICPMCGETKRLFVYEAGRTPPVEPAPEEAETAAPPPADAAPAEAPVEKVQDAPAAAPEFIDAGAVFSPDQMHRYRLWRTWEHGKGTCVFLMLNPSTADAEVLDPTVAKCVRYAKKWGFGRLEVVNLFAYRGTDPDDLLPLFMSVRIGEENDKAILAACQGAQRVVAAWGVHKAIGDRALNVLQMLTGAGVQLHALHLAKKATPGHPLYLKDTLEPRRIDLRGTVVRWAA